MPATPPLPPEDEPVALEEFVVSASPFARAQDEIVPPTSVLAGQRLIFQREASLGETLAHQPGITSTYFGPTASRPVIRGLGGDRIRVLTGGIGTLDASVISPDHAVSLDPLLIDRVEIVRGPATLLYGGSAIGGVVNVIDARIPETLPDSPLTGRLEARLGSAAESRSAALVLSGAAGPVAWRLDGFRRTSDDVRIPDFAEAAELRSGHDADEDGPPAHGFLPNSAATTDGAGFGTSYIGARGHIGVSFTGLNSLYGVPGHSHHDDPAKAPEGVRINLRQRRADLHAELHAPAAGLRALKAQFGLARYHHRELEGDEIGSRFSNRAHEGRFELLHEKIGGFEGALGLQTSRSDFFASGEEAFVPPSVTANHALFVFEEFVRDAHTWQFGARAERQTIEPRGVGLTKNAHTSVSGSFGWIWKFDERHTFAFSATRNERAPNAQELYANGPHTGTASFEIGDATLRAERSIGLDVSLRRRHAHVTGSVTAFLNRFDGYIFEENTGLLDSNSGLPLYRFVQRDAHYYGAELEAIVHLHETRGHLADFRLTTDFVRGATRSPNETLPRLPPLRLGGAIDYRHAGWSFTAEWRHTAHPGRLAPGESHTAAFTTLNFFASKRLKLGTADAEIFARATNLLDQTARLHTSFLKDIAPLPGRDITVGLRLTF